MSLDEEAKAVQEVAKLGTETLKAGEKFGSYLARVVGSIPDDLIGLAVGDWLHHKRQRNLARLQANTARILDQIERERFTEPSPSLLLPILQAAVDESREELQEIWAALLANAMIDGASRVRRAYIETIQKMEPLDVVVLSATSLVQAHEKSLNKQAENILEGLDKYKSLSAEGQMENSHRYMSDLSKKLALDDFNNMMPSTASKDEITISFFRLDELRCVQNGSHFYGFHHRLTSYGKGLLIACDRSRQVQQEGQS